MTKEKLFNKAYAHELLRIAQGDLESAQLLSKNIGVGRKENICYTAQQSIEKALKAVLCWLGKPIPMTHSIELVLDRLPSNIQPPGGDLLIELTDFATIKRYSEGNDIITNEDIFAILSAAKEVLAWATSVAST